MYLVKWAATLIFCSLLFLSHPLGSQETIASPNELVPRSIFEDFEIVAPRAMQDIILNPRMKFTNANLEGRKLLVLTEQEPCQRAGCMNVILTVVEQVLRDPIIFLSDTDGWLLDGYEPDQTSPVLCIAARKAYICNGVE